MEWATAGHRTNLLKPLRVRGGRCTRGLPDTPPWRGPPVLRGLISKTPAMQRARGVEPFPMLGRGPIGLTPGREDTRALHPLSELSFPICEKQGSPRDPLNTLCLTDRDAALVFSGGLG